MASRVKGVKGEKTRTQEAAAEFPHPAVGGPLLAREHRGRISLTHPPPPTPLSPLFIFCFFFFSCTSQLSLFLEGGKTIGAGAKQCKEERPGACAAAAFSGVGGRPRCREGTMGERALKGFFLLLGGVGGSSDV